jgi:hypothetical protein
VRAFGDHCRRYHKQSNGKGARKESAIGARTNGQLLREGVKVGNGGGEKRDVLPSSQFLAIRICAGQAVK